MVDSAPAIHPSPGRRDRYADRPAADTERHVEVFSGTEAATAHAAACAGLVYPPTQSPAWVRAWAGDTGHDHLAAILRQGERPVLALALETHAEGPFRVARFIGGSHANGNFPAFAPDGYGEATPEAVAALTRAIARARPDIDMLALERQLPEFAGMANPLRVLAHSPSPNVALAADLTGGFEALRGRVSGKRRAKKHRQQQRKLEAAGGYRRLEAKTPGEVDAMLEAFFAMKHARLTSMGIADVFGDPRVRAALRGLFRDALGSSRPAFVLHGLEVGGTLRAVTGSSYRGDRIICEFSAYSGELAETSPGEFLLWENIQEACAEGLAVYDLSVGDEHYKRMWCEIETWHFDAFAPLSLKGRLLAAGRFAATGAKRAAKANPAVWRVVSGLRANAARRG